MQKSSMDHRHDDLGWSEDESDDEEVDNTPAEEVESKLRMLLETEFKNLLKNGESWLGESVGKKNFQN